MEKQGYYTATYRTRLFCEKSNWVKDTILYYNKMVSFFYGYLLLNQELLHLTNQKVLRALEIRTLGEEKSKKDSVNFFPYRNVPLYVRRSAINTAIHMVRSYGTQYKKWEENKKYPKPKPAEQFHVSPIFYKGMYRNFQNNKIDLKLWNGEKWVWITCHFQEMAWNKSKKCLCPTIKFHRGKVMMHVPIVSIVTDIRTKKERVEAKENICAVSFPNQDNLAVMAVMDYQGKCLNTQFIKGEKELTHKRNYWMNRLKRCKAGMKDERKEMKYYPKYSMKLKNLTEHYAHLVSRRIVDYCIKQKVKLIIVPKYSNTIDFNKMEYLNATNYDWIGRKIIRYTRYKAFQNGILVTGVSPRNTASICHLCGKKIYKYNEGHYPNKNYYGGKKYVCEQGHRGNTAWNTAMNLGHVFLSKN